MMTTYKAAAPTRGGCGQKVLALGSCILCWFPHRHYHAAGDTVPARRQLGFRDADVPGECAVGEAERGGDEAAHDPRVGVADTERRRVLGGEADRFDRDVVVL